MIVTGTTQPVVEKRAVAVIRKGFLGGGRGIGGSACFVCSYRSAIRSVSSLEDDRRVPCLVLWRILVNRCGAMVARRFNVSWVPSQMSGCCRDLGASYCPGKAPHSSSRT